MLHKRDSIVSLFAWRDFENCRESKPMERLIDLVSRNALASGFVRNNRADLTGASARRLIKRPNQHFCVQNGIAVAFY
jgi:hypothetical protein